MNEAACKHCSRAVFFRVCHPVGYRPSVVGRPTNHTQIRAQRAGGQTLVVTARVENLRGGRGWGAAP
eukprot:scaffold227966_cov33-Tisochrysis_lutea.AAC.1